MNNQPALFPRVFVYGTLKKNFPAHGLLAGASYLGECFLIGYGMRHCGNYPAAVDLNGSVHHRILGEVYELNMEQHTKMLETLDKYEHVDGGLYERVEVSTAMFGRVFVYVQKMPTYSYDAIQDGIWRGTATPAYTVVGGGVPPVPGENTILSNLRKEVDNFNRTQQQANTLPVVAKPTFQANDLKTMLWGGVEVIRRPK